MGAVLIAMLYLHVHDANQDETFRRFFSCEK